MTYRLTYWAPMCNGEGMEQTEDFSAAGDTEALVWMRRFFKKHPDLSSRGIGRTPRLERVSTVEIKA